MVVLPDAGFRRARAEITSWPGYAPTPLLHAAGCRRGRAGSPPSTEGRGGALRPRQLQGAGRRLCGGAAAGRTSWRGAASPMRRRRPNWTGGATPRSDAGHHRHLRDGRQPWPLRRLGRAALRLPLRHLRARDGQPGPRATPSRATAPRSACVPGTYDDAVRAAAAAGGGEGLVRRLRHLLRPATPRCRATSCRAIA